SLEHVQGTRRLQAPIVRNDDRLPLGQCGGNSHDRTRTLLHDHGEGVVRFALRGKVKKGLLTEQDQVRLLSLQEQALGGGTALLPHLTRRPGPGTLLCIALQALRHRVLRVREHYLVTLHFVGSCPKRHRLRLADRWGINDAKSDEYRLIALRPADTECHS